MTLFFPEIDSAFEIGVTQKYTLERFLHRCPSSILSKNGDHFEAENSILEKKFLQGTKKRPFNHASFQSKKPNK